MAVDRIYLRCRHCKEECSIAKFYTVAHGFYPSPNTEGDPRTGDSVYSRFLEKHSSGCAMSADGDHRVFELAYESDWT